MLVCLGLPYLNQDRVSYLTVTINLKLPWFNTTQVYCSFTSESGADDKALLGNSGQGGPG